MTAQELRRGLQASSLGRVADRLLDMAAPMIRIYIEVADETAIPVGASKKGSRPDLPTGVAWPSWHEPVAFVPVIMVKQEGEIS
jgi:hypothetical protein